MNYIERYLLRMGFHTIQAAKSNHIREFLDAGLIVLALLKPLDREEAVHMLEDGELLFDCSDEIKNDENIRALLKRIVACFS